MKNKLHVTHGNHEDIMCNKDVSRMRSSKTHWDETMSSQCMFCWNFIH
jgi:hypothetical protein